MKLKDIAAISGKPGLYKIFKPTKTGVIVESLDDKKSKMVVGAAHRISVLKEVSVYTTDQEGSLALAIVLDKIREAHKGELAYDAKSSKEELTEFIESIVPNYDKDKVYPSDIKKLVSWYNIILKYTPETLETLLQEDEEEKKEKVDEEEKPKKESKKAESKKEEAVEKAEVKEKKTTAKAKTTAKKEEKTESTAKPKATAKAKKEEGEAKGKKTTAKKK